MKINHKLDKKKFNFIFILKISKLNLFEPKKTLFVLTHLKPEFIYLFEHNRSELSGFR